MNRRGVILCGLMSAGLGGCAADPVQPSPTADQVMAAQYRAQGERGAISGPEASAIAGAYHQAIAKAPQSASSGETRNDTTPERNP
jgi:hypothetical protein